MGNHDSRPHVLLWGPWTCIDDCSKKFQQKLLWLHTPDVMNKLICNSMDSWLAPQQVTLLVWTGPNEPIHGALHCTFRVQAKIRWDQFFCGVIAKDWKWPITVYYKIWQPGESYTSDQWMWTIIKELWILSITIPGMETTKHGTSRHWQCAIPQAMT
jgi:hypothetical protein